MISFNKDRKNHFVFKNKMLKGVVTVETDDSGMKYVELRARGFVLPNQTDSIKIRKEDYTHFNKQRITTFLTDNFGLEVGEALFYYIAETCFKLKVTEKVLFS